jgi:hypothetical protein
MSERANRFIATAALLALGGALMPATVAKATFRPCGSDEVLYDPSTDDIGMYYSPIGKYVIFPLAGQLRYLGRSRLPDYNAGNYGVVTPDPQWRLEAAKKVTELRATGKCKTTAGG